jgi:hypothetical protein
MKLSDQNYIDPEDKDPWPDPPMQVSTDHTPEQWASHTVAFDPSGFGSPGRAPMLTVVNDLD